MRVSIFDAGGGWTTAPESLPDGWTEWIGPFISEHAVVRTSKGPRTVATEALQNRISRSVAYPTVEAMVEHHGVYIDDDPDEGDPTEVWVPYEAVAQVCDDDGVTPRALQVELDARGDTSDRVPGVSDETTMGGEWITYWVFSATFASPKAYEPKPQSPTERVDGLFDESPGGTGDDGDDGDGDEQPRTGVIGSSNGQTPDPGSDADADTPSSSSWGRAASTGGGVNE